MKDAHLFALPVPLRPEGGYGEKESARGHLRILSDIVSSVLSVDRSMLIPSQGEVPSSIALHGSDGVSVMVKCANYAGMMTKRGLNSASARSGLRKYKETKIK
nr:hypothetical protein CFP56_48754 [Quercus suber]